MGLVDEEEEEEEEDEEDEQERRTSQPVVSMDVQQDVLEPTGTQPTVTRPPPPALPADFESPPQKQKISAGEHVPLRRCDSPLTVTHDHSS